MINIVYNIIDLIKKDNPSNIAVLATKKTIDSHIFKNNINNIIEISCPKIVPYIEKNIGNINDILKEYLSYIKEKHINNIVLGCTHYPLIKKDIQEHHFSGILGSIIHVEVEDFEEFKLIHYLDQYEKNLLSKYLYINQWEKTETHFPVTVNSLNLVVHPLPFQFVPFVHTKKNPSFSFRISISI